MAINKAPRAEQWAGQIRAQLSKSAEAIIATGRLLVKAKADLPHGEWERMATASAFVAAVSLVVRVPEFDAAIFKHRVSVSAGQMTKRSTRDAYLTEIEALYNYQAKGKRIPLAFRAREVSLARHANFGRSEGPKA